MDKTYSNFMDEISMDELYEGFLAYGFFADKLPPVFSSVSFFNYCQANNPAYEVKSPHDFITFRSMRNINVPRTLGIPTPMKYQLQCAVIRDNWDTLKKHFHSKTDGESYRISRIHIRKLYGTKALFEMNYKDWRVDGNPETDLLFQDGKNTTSNYLHHISRYLVKADISTCFPSIYSHSLAWALVGKDQAKNNRNDNLWYNQLDHACSLMKNGETHGLIIGPHTSNLLSEIVLTSIDKELYDKGYRYIRNIDDYDCYVESDEEAKKFLRDLESTLNEYDLPLNHKKTHIIELPVANAESWIHKLNAMQLVSGFGQTSFIEINAYIDVALRLANETGNSAVLKYAIKTLSGKKITTNGKKLAAKRVMHLAVIYPYLLQLMEQYVFKPFDTSKEEIKAFADTVYSEAVNVNNYEAVCYAIYFSLRHGFALDKLAIDWVISQGDCILLVMTWLYYLKANHGKTRASALKPLRDEALRLRNTDMDRYWLFCYEVLTKGNLKGEWAGLKEGGVSFISDEFRYDMNAANNANAGN